MEEIMDINPTTLGTAALAIGAQDCHAEAAGAFTGDVSATMLKDFGVRYVIVGHSERRLHQADRQRIAPLNVL